MKVAITGSRKVTNVGLIEFVLKLILNNYNIKPISLTSGGANGVDKVVETFFPKGIRNYTSRLKT